MHVCLVCLCAFAIESRTLLCGGLDVYGPGRSGERHVRPCPTLAPLLQLLCTLGSGGAGADHESPVREIYMHLLNVIIPVIEEQAERRVKLAGVLKWADALANTSPPESPEVVV